MTLSLAHERAEPVAFQPALRCEDALARYWLSQATWRLRREVAWLWHERAAQTRGAGEVTAASDQLPPFSDRALSSLDLTRYELDKRAFFARDTSAHYLSERIAQPAPRPTLVARGSFAWVAEDLALSPAECFLLSLALLPALDSAAGSVIATCLNDPQRGEPTLALAQRLWERPEEMIAAGDATRPLLRTGVLQPIGPTTTNPWHAPLQVSAALARTLIYPHNALPQPLEAVEARAVDRESVIGADPSPAMPACKRLRILPLVAPVDADLARLAAAYAERLGLTCARPDPALNREHLAELLTLSWLHGHALYVPLEWVLDAGAHERRAHIPLPGLAHTLLIGSHDAADLRVLPASAHPPLSVPPLNYDQRLRLWQQSLPAATRREDAAELARRFRYESAAIERAGAALAGRAHPPVLADLIKRVQRDVDPGGLAQKVTPRFALPELMLPPAQTRQMDEIVTALRNLTRAHHVWGTARAWNEAGLAVLFAGPPGTGKTMAAEAIAHELALPLYRIDLSQVVNKYIGETEKNLRRLFDQAEAADVILFFDEADALFGKRTEVKDAHDRYANLEISYLLERMERFKGLAILATNRRKDLDEAFLRRLRYVVQFPLPSVAERERIWRAVMPAGVDCSEVDFAFLAQSFPLAGGHIRAVVFHACLQSASESAPRVLTMAALIQAVRREYDKLERAISLEQFGAYAGVLQLDGGTA